MRRDEFVSIFLGYVIKKAPSWLPEESTEENMVEVMRQRINEHADQIKDVVERNNIDK